VIATSGGSWIFGEDGTTSYPANVIAASFTGSLQGTASWAYSSSNAITSSYSLTSSYALNAGNVNTSSFIITASANNNAITFTKGNSNSFSVTVDTGSAIPISVYNQSSQLLTTTASSINFVGAGVTTAGGTGGTITVVIPGGGGGIPGGSPYEIQYNNNGFFNGVPALTYSASILSITGSLQGTASYATTASYALNSSGTGFPFSGSAVITGSLLVSGSGITGSLQGTASYAITASYALNAFSVPSGPGFNITASFTNLSTWTFVHSLSNKWVLIKTYDTSYNEIIPQNIQLYDDNTAIITFPSLESGYAVATVGGGSTIEINNTASALFATTGSNTFTGNQYISSNTNATNFTSIASLYTDGGLRVTKDAYVSGTIYVNNLTVYGTQSVSYITSSQLNISTNLITYF
jgi:cytoskeletal protein CcmA (bactofilin family)